VLFTGLEDEAGERVLARLGGSMAKGVADMNCLVTDKVRRTVKFLCAVAKGVPIVTTHWLEKVSCFMNRDVTIIDFLGAIIVREIITVLLLLRLLCIN